MKQRKWITIDWLCESLYIIHGLQMILLAVETKPNVVFLQITKSFRFKYEHDYDYSEQWWH